jgi:hypothetical protein
LKRKRPSEELRATGTRRPQLDRGAVKGHLRYELLRCLHPVTATRLELR